MADPFSLVAAGLGVADVSIRLIKYLKDVKAAAESIEEDIGGLISEVEALMAVHGQLEHEYARHAKNEAASQEEKKLWSNTGRTLKNGQTLVQRLDESIRQIYGDDPTVVGKRDGLIKQHRKRNREAVIFGFRNQISTCHGALKIWLECISMYSAREHHKDQKSQLENLSTLVKGLESKLTRIQDVQSPPPYERVAASTHLDISSISLTVLNQIDKSINSIGDDFINKHFETPKPIDLFYTGREAQAENLRRWLLPERSTDKEKVTGKDTGTQKRFVVYGVGGAGKTQFCCKFAEDNRERFWGVFWVDGSSQKRLEQTFAQNVSTVGGVAANSQAALQWLEKQHKPWLLIIDNADDPELELNNYFPKGPRGHILITTRDPSGKHYGTVGTRSFEFQGLESEDASCLLLKASGLSRPWDSDMSSFATSIARKLGYLAIAITQAGKTIRQGYCKLQEYLEYWERQWKKKRRNRLPVKAKDAFDDLKVFATFELNRIALEERDSEACRDALQLLNTFAFLHHQNIRFSMLKRSVVNPGKESEQAEKDKKIQLEARVKESYSWAAWWLDTKIAIQTSIFRNRSPPVLPGVIRDGRKIKPFDPDRLRRALRQLTKFSLLIHNNKHDDKTEAYSMHPLVHKWARERPDMSFLEQSVWCEAAAVLLSSCILLQDDSTEEEDVRRYLLPHVEFVSKNQQDIEQRIQDMRMARMKPWPLFDGGFNAGKTLMYAKFSFVYAHNGQYEEAKRLQRTVRNVLLQALGPNHVNTRRITLALSITLFALGETDDSAELRSEVYDTCKGFLGEQHHETLNAKTMLGDSRFTQGRFTDSKVLLEKAVADMEKLLPAEHKDTLNAMDYLGRTLKMFQTKEYIARARELHQRAVEGMKKAYGPHHRRTLEACENLCSTAVMIGDMGELLEANEMMEEVLSVRKKNLGKEHAFTLLAMANLSTVRSALGDLTGAEQLLQSALNIGERDLGRDHQACLWGRYLLGKIMVKREEWTKAEPYIIDVTNRQMRMLQGRGRNHPDRLAGLVDLAKVCHALGKTADRDRVAYEALEGLEKISGSEHPVAKAFARDIDIWKAKEDKNIAKLDTQ